MITIVLVVAGVSIAGVFPTWRGAFLGLGLQYLGVAIVLFGVSGVIGGVVTIVTAIGIEALVASDPGISLRDGTWLVNPLAGVRIDQINSLDVDRRRVRRRPRRRNSSGGGARVRWFDLSVIALAVVGALGVAVGRPTFGGFAADASVGVLILTGLLYCLLGGLPRLTSGLLFIGSAANILLNESESTLAPAETLLVAVGLITLTLALSFLRGQEARLADPLSRSAPTSEPVQPDDSLLATVDPVASP